MLFMLLHNSGRSPDLPLVSSQHLKCQLKANDSEEMRNQVFYFDHPTKKITQNLKFHILFK